MNDPTRCQPEHDRAHPDQKQDAEKTEQNLARGRAERLRKERSTAWVVGTDLSEEVSDTPLFQHARELNDETNGRNTRIGSLARHVVDDHVVDVLEQQGLPIRVDRSDYHMHHKYAVFDGKLLLTGSYNWTRSAARNNEENFVDRASSVGQCAEVRSRRVSS